MAVTDPSEKRPEWCPPGRSRYLTRPTRPGSQSSSGSTSKRPNSSSFSRHSPSPTTPLSVVPSPRVRRNSSNQPSNPQLSRSRSSSPTPDDGAVSEASSPDIHGKHKEPELKPSQRTQNPSPLFSLPKELFFVRESGQSYEFGLSSGHDVLTLKWRLEEEIRLRCRLQDQLAELDAQLTKVSKHCHEAESRANDFEQQLNAALEGQATQQASNQSEAASILPDIRATPANPEEFTPENYVWVTQEWERVAQENLRLDNCLHIASIQKHHLEREIIRLSREVENYEKPNIGHGKSMIDAAQQTEEEEPTQMTAVATQTEFGDQKDTENGPTEPEYQAVPPQQPRTVTTDAIVQAVEQPDEHMLSNELSDQITKASEVLEVRIQEFGEERLDRKIEVCVKQEDSGQGSSSQTKASKGKGIARETTMAQNEQSSMTREFELLQPLASNIPQGNGFAGLQYENERLRRENDEMRNTLEQHQLEDSRPEGPESHHGHASPEETQVWNTNPGAEVEDADVEMGGDTVGQDLTALQNIEAPVIPTIPPATSEAGKILRFNLQRFLSSINRDTILSSDDARRRGDSQRHERLRLREQRRLKREEKAHHRKQRRTEREQDNRRPRNHHRRAHKMHRQKKKIPSPLGWVRYRRTFIGFFSLRHMFSSPVQLS